MYVDKLFDENIGPIENASINFPFKEDGTPKPIIIVGENGSGKSTLLSNIVDALYSIAAKQFQNAMQPDDNGIGHQYYKAISPTEIKVGKEYLYSHILFKNNPLIHYIFKSGRLSVENIKAKDPNGKLMPFSWEVEGNAKNVNASEKDAGEIFKTDAICYFGPGRYEKPMWMGRKYFDSSDNLELDEKHLHPSVQVNLDGVLKNPISIKNVTEVNLQWLMDVIVDSRSDIKIDQEKLCIDHFVPGKLAQMLNVGIARKNLEAILSNILGRDVYFALNFRNGGASRFKIVESNTGAVVAPTLDSLSTGQIALFNMFSTIVRYGESADIKKSVTLQDISGIVVIDEVELHLHTRLQKDVLPKLIKLFPKVQFVITSHAPLFLLGMQEEFGDDGFEIYEMPNGLKTSTEDYAEFKYAYDSVMRTRKATEDRKRIVQATMDKLQNLIGANEKALIITEGCTDWKHMSRAWGKLKGAYPDIQDKFEFLRFGPEGDSDSTVGLEMGVSTLVDMCRQYSKLPQHRKMIFIADTDNPKESKDLRCEAVGYKNWGNNVFSFEIPVPDSRKSIKEGICIEHYYADEEIITEKDVDGVCRRLYLAKEFSPRTGRNAERTIMFEGFKNCNMDKRPYKIIEGDKGNRVGRSDEEEEFKTNLCLPKTAFASAIYHEEAPFNKISSENFHLIFDVLQQIISA